MKFMRIVAMNANAYFIQEAERIGCWKQRVISFEDFINYMKENFVKEYNEFVESGKSVDDFFYDYGCSDETIEVGESYIFAVNK